MWGKKNVKIPVEVSARHCHLSKEDLEKLFGVGHELQKLKQLSQPSDFACQETVDLQFGPPAGGKKIERVRVVGPTRLQTQIEISFTDAIGSGIRPLIKLSGDLNGTSPTVLTGPKGAVSLAEGLIVAMRHIHCATAEAAKLGLKNGTIARVRIGGVRSVIFEDVAIRVRNDYKLCLHLDTDEGNAAGIDKMGQGEIIF